MEADSNVVEVVSEDGWREGPYWSLRAATSEDGEALCRLVSDARLSGRPDDAEDRSPDFFALRRVQSHGARTWVVLDEGGDLAGCGTLTVREAWVRGKRMKLGRLTDLRLKPELRGGGVFPEVFARVLKVAHEDFGLELFAGLVDEEDLPTLAALMHRGAHRLQQPRAQTITPMRRITVALKALGERPAREVVRATPSDVEALTAFLDQQRRSRIFGHVTGEDSLGAELSRWPGLSLDDFYLTREAGEIVGCVAPWDPAPVRRWMYTPPQTWLGGVGRRWAVLRGAVPRPPSVGSPWCRLELSHLEVAGDDPSILRDLLMAVGRDRSSVDATHLSLLIPRGYKLGRALEGVRHHSAPVAFVLFCAPGSKWCNVDFRSLRPGLEPALW